MYPQADASKVSDYSHIPKLPSSDKKFIQHFHSINTPSKPNPNFTKSMLSNKKNFSTIIEGYATSPLIIDKIVNEPIKQSWISQVQAQELEFVTCPLLLNLNPGIRQRITRINKFFDQKQPSQPISEPPTSLLSYIQAVSAISTNNHNRHLERHSSKSRSKSKKKQSPNGKTQRKGSNIPFSTPPKIKPMQEAEVNTDPIENSGLKSPQKLKKIDLILVQIMRQKKRKGIVSDYFKAIQMKLTELLEYILEDQKEYYSLSPVDKMKAVLRNLQSFKGKTIDGQSKVNMLRIFFEEFRNLKKQRQDAQNRQMHQKSNTPPKSKANQNQFSKKSSHQSGFSQNRPQPSYQDKSFGKNKSSKGGNSNNYLGIPSPMKSSKGTKKNYQTMSVGGNGKSIANQSKIKKGPKSSMLEQDEWMGSLG